MKNITLIYIFALYVLFIPGFCLKQNKFLHSLLFSLCLYFTYDIVNHSVENYETSLEIKGMDNLGDLTKKEEKKQDRTVVVNNKISTLPKKYYENENGGNTLLMTSYKTIDKLKEENQDMHNNLKAYEGDNDKIDVLKAKMDSYKNQITDLKTQLNSYKGTDTSADELNKLVNKLQSQVHSLKTRLANSKHKIK